MRIKYKVVTSNRKSIVIPSTSMFSLRYNKDNIVEALPNSLGIMVFSSRDYAILFKFMLGFHSQIIKVRPIGKKFEPESICMIFRGASQTTKALIEFNKNGQSQIITPPEGTECYQSVEVLN